jgi:hypothetical protein
MLSYDFTLIQYGLGISEATFEGVDTFGLCFLEVFVFYASFV